MERLKDEESGTDARPKKQLHNFIWKLTYNLEDIILQSFIQSKDMPGLRTEKKLVVTNYTFEELVRSYYSFSLT